MNQLLKNEYISYGAASSGMNTPFMLGELTPVFKKLFRAWVLKDYFNLDSTKFYTVKVKYVGKHGAYGSYHVRIFERKRQNPFKLIHNKLLKHSYNPNYVIIDPSVFKAEVQYLGENGKILPLETCDGTVKVYPTSQEMGERMEKLKEKD